jgi:signal transduction histidine kinase
VTLPAWTRSIRFRMTVLYSAVLFALAALLVGALYVGLSYSLRSESLSRGDVLVEVRGPGTPPGAGRTFIDSNTFEEQVNEHTLESLRNFSLGALGVLFVASLAVGWVIAGRALAPIERIGGVAREIQATNLSRRIGLDGPEDELKRLADTFDDMLARLDAAFAAQRQFVADASHELRNPVAIIQANADLLLAEEGATEPIRRRSDRIRRASERVARLVEDLLALARLEAPRVRPEQVDLGELVRETVDELAGDEEEARLDWRVEPDVHLVGDRTLLKRALANLIDNALRHAPPGSTVNVRTGHDGGWAYLAVTDRGPGIALEHQVRIFDRFFRVDKARSRARGGSGLGLSIVRQITEAHGGHVRVFSRPAEGSTFVLWLPLNGSGPEPPDVDPSAGATRQTAPTAGPLAL